VSAAEALRAARAAGIELGTDGDHLVLAASAPPPAVVLDLLSHHKLGIMALLRPGPDGWSAEDWQVFSTSGQASPSLTAVCRASTRRLAPSPAVSSNG